MALRSEPLLIVPEGGLLVCAMSSTGAGGRYRMKKLPFLAIVVAVLAWGAGAWAQVLPNNRHIFINVANTTGVKYNVDGATYGGPSGTYYIKSDGGGLNELGISNTSDPAFPKVDVAVTSNGSNPSGTFYLTNTGGRGFDDDIVLLVSVKGPFSPNFSLTMTSRGYSWTPAAAGVYNPSVPTNYAYIGGMSQTFYASDFIYGPQAYKPGPGALGTWSLPLYNGEQPAGNTDPAFAEYLMFVDLYAGNMKPGSFPGVGLINDGAVRVDFQFSGLYDTAAFNGYGWCSAANQGQGISWSNLTTTTPPANSISGYAISYNGPVAPSGVSVNPWHFAFGSVAVSQSSSPRTFTVTNTGGAAVTVGALNVTGANAAEFSIASDTCSGNLVGAGGSCTVDAIFSPTSAGSKTAVLDIPVNGSSLGVALTGSGALAELSVTPQTLDFGTILLPDNGQGGITPAGCADNEDGTVSCWVTVTNASAGPLSNIALSTGAGPFTVSPSMITGPLAAGESTTAVVTYTATDGSTPADTGTLSVSAGGYNASVSLTGVTNTRPARPVAGLPLSATNVSLTPTLTASAFSDADGDTQTYATWEISTDDRFAFSYGQFNTNTVVLASINDPANLASFTVPPGALQPGVTYYWSVGYTDSRGATSVPSALMSFTTMNEPMNGSSTTPLAMTVRNSAGNEVTVLSDLAGAVANGTASARLIADLGGSAVINSGTAFDPNSQSPTVAIVRENRGSSSSVLGIVTPAGTNITTLTTTVTSDAAFRSPPPASYTFPAGVVAFTLTGVAGGNNPIRVTIYTPADLPANAVWYKYSPARGWLQINGNGTYDVTGTTLISPATTFAVVNGKGVLTITDNDATDLNPLAGVVLDPGAPAVPGPVAPAPVPDDTGPGGGGRCFIATAAFGSYLDPYVVILRKFRDVFLLTSSPGRSFVEWYYRVSPSIADRIGRSESLRACVRAVLVPVVGFSFLCLKVGVLPAVLLCALSLLVIGIPVTAHVRRRVYRGGKG